ncbi:AMP-dependent synthetase and ligase [Chloroherpeton thalassium ATCC 35110]|uniref:AMP-dependent synthetase and ligase n=1 Tax=Chloroherpeton thalassium (strain ATCC 35110 / GB-78) TaxID=517418 RepID=B3QVD6_CHLT3|nr:long-chain fatty acid--CoA ligase [Chloroherpeton thalassium]ACF14536.1 AMP-dependent synthetase and ligase [Chloroherpeton thalassium ATCC 35110]
MGLINPSFKTLAELFDAILAHYKEQPQNYGFSRKVDGEYHGISYKYIANHVYELAAYLKAIGIQKGDRVAILSENRIEWVITDMATLKIGAINVPLYPSTPANQLAYILQDSGAKAIVTSTQLQTNKIRRVKNELPELKTLISINPLEAKEDGECNFSAALKTGEAKLKNDPDFLKTITISEDDIATLIYTSGTTGNPKGVMLTHRNICENIKSCSAILPLSEDDACLSFLPLSHAYERTVGYYLMFACGIKIYYAESIETISLNISEVRPTVVITVPRLFERIKSSILKNVDNGAEVRKKLFYWALHLGYQHHADQRSGRSNFFVESQYALANLLILKQIRERFGGRLRFFVSGGAALPPDTGLFFEALGITILEGFGLTETAPVTHVNRPGKVKFGTVGTLLKNVEVKIADDGEILLRGPNIMKGYWQDDAATAEVIRNGWFHTGDIGEIDSEGYLKITDRKKHIIVNSGGKNIAPLPIENRIHANKYIDQALVVGEKRPFLIALIVPNFENLEALAKQKGLAYSNFEELISHHEIYQLYTNILRDISRELASHERVRKFLLLSEPFTIEDGHMTPTLKLRRSKIEEKFKQKIHDLYKGVAYDSE